MHNKIGSNRALRTRIPKMNKTDLKMKIEVMLVNVLENQNIDVTNINQKNLTEKLSKKAQVLYTIYSPPHWKNRFISDDTSTKYAKNAIEVYHKLRR